MVCTCTESFEQQKERAGYDQSTIEIFETCSEKLALSNYFDDQFDDYLATYDKEYTDREEYDDHVEAFREQSEEMWKHNQRYERGDETYGQSWNRYSDYTNRQWKSMLRTYKVADDTTFELTEEPATTEQISNEMQRWEYLASYLTTYPFNWVDEGKVTPVRDQGMCGGGYAFAIAGAVESMRAITRGNLNVLSPQQILDCDEGYNKGCEGGAMTYAANYTLGGTGLMTE
jgi:hypothetical protein